MPGQYLDLARIALRSGANPSECRYMKVVPESMEAGAGGGVGGGLGRRGSKERGKGGVGMVGGGGGE